MPFHTLAREFTYLPKAHVPGPFWIVPRVPLHKHLCSSLSLLIEEQT